MHCAPLHPLTLSYSHPLRPHAIDHLLHEWHSVINVMGCFTLLSSQVAWPFTHPKPTHLHPHAHLHSTPPHTTLPVSRAQWYAHRLLHKMGKDCGHNHGPSANCASDLLKP